MAAAAGARLAAWGERLRRGFAAGRRAWLGPGPVAAAVAGVAVAGAGAAWYHGRVNVAAPQGSLTVLAQVRDGPSPEPRRAPQASGGRRVGMSSGRLGRPWGSRLPAGTWGRVRCRPPRPAGPPGGRAVPAGTL